jgi:hypothetical protein
MDLVEAIKQAGTQMVKPVATAIRPREPKMQYTTMKNGDQEFDAPFTVTAGMNPQLIQVIASETAKMVLSSLAELIQLSESAEKAPAENAIHKDQLPLIPEASDTEAAPI